MAAKVWDIGLSGLGFRDEGLGFRDGGLGFRVYPHPIPLGTRVTASLENPLHHLSLNPQHSKP